MPDPGSKANSWVPTTALVVAIVALLVAIVGILVPIILPLKTDQNREIAKSWDTVMGVDVEHPNWISVRAALEYLNSNYDGFGCKYGIVKVVAQLFGRDRRCLDPEKKSVSFAHCEFERFELKDVELPGADLAHAKLNGATLTRANLRDASLRKAEMIGTDLRNSNLTGADLSDAVLFNADLQGTVLIDTDISGANLEGAKNVTAVQLRSACASMDRPPIGVTSWNHRSCPSDSDEDLPERSMSSSASDRCEAK